AGIDVGLVATGLVGETWRTWGAWGPAVDAAEALAARGENAPIVSERAEESSAAA
ncbi:MAG: hypothetical protein ACI9WU_005085, partial [Myxococcota bacterium]